MAVSPELIQVNSALTHAREYMVGEYSDFLRRIGELSPEYFLLYLKECSKTPDAHPKISFLTDAGKMDYEAEVKGHATKYGITGLSLRLVKKDPEFIKGAPQYFLAGVSLEDPLDPLVIGRGWDVKKPGVMNTILIAEDNKVAKIIQHTTRDTLLKRTNPPDPNDLRPVQCLSVGFWYLRGELFSWDASFSCIEKEYEFDLSLKMSSQGEYFKDGDKIEEYELPKELIMPDCIDNIVNRVPAMLGAYIP